MWMFGHDRSWARPRRVGASTLTCEGPTMSGEHFIPFRKTDVVSMCADELPEPERESFRGFARMLASLLHHRFRDRIEALKDAYLPFNPEADTRTVVELSAEQRLAAHARLEEELTGLARA